MRSVTHTDLWPFDKRESLMLAAFVLLFVVYVLGQIFLVPWLAEVTR